MLNHRQTSILPLIQQHIAAGLVYSTVLTRLQLCQLPSFLFSSNPRLSKDQYTGPADCLLRIATAFGFLVQDQIPQYLVFCVSSTSNPARRRWHRSRERRRQRRRQRVENEAKTA
uniref:Uncharacterized protein n=1 Tax=Opuntia streptacantha TaxID=393608 RepID=A0A7C8ZBT6_OPUST